MENNNIDFYGAMLETFNELEDLFHLEQLPEFAKKSSPIFMSIRDRFKIHGLENSPIYGYINELELAIHNGNRVKTTMSFDDIRINLAKLAGINAAYVKPRRSIIEIYANEVQNGFNRAVRPSISDKEYARLVAHTAISQEVRAEAREAASGISSIGQSQVRKKSNTKIPSTPQKRTDVPISLG